MVSFEVCEDITQLGQYQGGGGKPGLKPLTKIMLREM
jgi:hypothetical protein